MLVATFEVYCFCFLFLAGLSWAVLKRGAHFQACFQFTFLWNRSVLLCYTLMAYLEGLVTLSQQSTSFPTVLSNKLLRTWYHDIVCFINLSHPYILLLSRCGINVGSNRCADKSNQYSDMQRSKTCSVKLHPPSCKRTKSIM